MMWIETGQVGLLTFGFDEILFKNVLSIGLPKPCSCSRGSTLPSGVSGLGMALTGICGRFK
jgi:hypothetical protein